MENGVLEARHFLSRLKHAGGNCFASVVPLLVALQTRTWKMGCLRRATFCRASNTQVEMVYLRRAAFMPLLYVTDRAPVLAVDEQASSVTSATGVDHFGGVCPETQLAFSLRRTTVNLEDI